MDTRSVIVEYRADPELDRQATSSATSLEAEPLAHLLAIDAVPFDLEFAPVRLPGTAPQAPAEPSGELGTRSSSIRRPTARPTSCAPRSTTRRSWRSAATTLWSACSAIP